MVWKSEPVDCVVDFETGSLEGRTAVVTGGASGIGEGFVRALHAAGVHVTIGDMDVAGGEKLASELSGTKFVQCDVTSWEDQVRLFEEAVALSSMSRIRYVVPTAGVATGDDVFAFDGADAGPQKPNLNTIDVKSNGVRQSPDQEDTCLVLIGSGASFLDCPRGPQYSATKWGARGILHALRRVTHNTGTRVNMIAPWYVRTNIIPESAFKGVEDNGVVLATVEQAGECLLRILSDDAVNGRMLFLSGSKWSTKGYLDLDIDDYHTDTLQEIQADQLLGAPPEAGYFLEGQW